MRAQLPNERRHLGSLCIHDVDLGAANEELGTMPSSNRRWATAHSNLHRSKEDTASREQENNPQNTGR